MIVNFNLKKWFLKFNPYINCGLPGGLPCKSFIGSLSNIVYNRAKKHFWFLLLRRKGKIKLI